MGVCLGLFWIVGRSFELMSFNRVYKTHVSTHVGARYLEVVASKSEDAGREDNFQYKRYADVLRDVQLSGTLFGILSPRISDWSVFTHWKWIRLNKFRGRRRGSHRETP